MRRTGLVFLTSTLLAGCAGSINASQSPLAFLEKAGQAEPKLTPYEKGKQNLQLKNYGLAIAAFQEELRQDPMSVRALNGLAVAYDQLGRQDVAQRLLDQALNFDPNSVVTLNNLAYLNLTEGNTAVALAYSERAKIAAKDNGDMPLAPAVANAVSRNAEIAMDVAKNDADAMLPAMIANLPDKEPDVKRVGLNEWELHIRPSPSWEMGIPLMTAPSRPEVIAPVLVAPAMSDATVDTLPSQIANTGSAPVDVVPAISPSGAMDNVLVAAGPAAVPSEPRPAANAQQDMPGAPIESDAAIAEASVPATSVAGGVELPAIPAFRKPGADDEMKLVARAEDAMRNADDLVPAPSSDVAPPQEASSSAADPSTVAAAPIPLPVQQAMGTVAQPDAVTPEVIASASGPNAPAPELPNSGNSDVAPTNLSSSDLMAAPSSALVAANDLPPTPPQENPLEAILPPSRPALTSDREQVAALAPRASVSSVPEIVAPSSPAASNPAPQAPDLASQSKGPVQQALPEVAPIAPMPSSTMMAEIAPPQATVQLPLPELTAPLERTTLPANGSASPGPALLDPAPGSHAQPGDSISPPTSVSQSSQASSEVVIAGLVSGKPDSAPASLPSVEVPTSPSPAAPVIEMPAAIPLPNSDGADLTAASSGLAQSKEDVMVASIPDAAPSPMLGERARPSETVAQAPQAPAIPVTEAPVQQASPELSLVTPVPPANVMAEIAIPQAGVELPLPQLPAPVAIMTAPANSNIATPPAALASVEAARPQPIPADGAFQKSAAPEVKTEVAQTPAQGELALLIPSAPARNVLSGAKPAQEKQGRAPAADQPRAVPRQDQVASATPPRAENRPVQEWFLQLPAGASVRVSNGAGRRLMAARFANYFEDHGLSVAHVANARSFKYRSSVIFYNPDQEGFARNLARLLPFSVKLVAAKGRHGSIELVLGSDLLSFDNALRA